MPGVPTFRLPLWRDSPTVPCLQDRFINAETLNEHLALYTQSKGHSLALFVDSDGRREYACENRNKKADAAPESWGQEEDTTAATATDELFCSYGFTAVSVAALAAAERLKAKKAGMEEWYIACNPWEPHQTAFVLTQVNAVHSQKCIESRSGYIPSANTVESEVIADGAGDGGWGAVATAAAGADDWTANVAPAADAGDWGDEAPAGAAVQATAAATGDDWGDDAPSAADPALSAVRGVRDEWDDADESGPCISGPSDESAMSMPVRKTLRQRLFTAATDRTEGSSGEMSHILPAIGELDSSSEAVVDTSPVLDGTDPGSPGTSLPPSSHAAALYGPKTGGPHATLANQFQDARDTDQPSIVNSVSSPDSTVLSSPTIVLSNARVDVTSSKPNSWFNVHPSRQEMIDEWDTIPGLGSAGIEIAEKDPLFPSRTSAGHPGRITGSNDVSVSKKRAWGPASVQEKAKIEQQISADETSGWGAPPQPAGAARDDDEWE